MTTDSNRYLVGDLVKIVGRFQDPLTLGYIQPAQVAFEVMDATGAVTHPDPIFDAHLQTADGITGGGYSVEINVDVPGTWYYRIEATGTGQSAQEGSFYVERSAFEA